MSCRSIIDVRECIEATRIEREIMPAGNPHTPNARAPTHNKMSFVYSTKKDVQSAG